MLKRIRSLVSNSSFIEIYDNALSKKECHILISQFEKLSKVEGKTQQGVDPGCKQCVEIAPFEKISFKNPSRISNIIQPVLWNHVGKYADKYYTLRNHIQPWNVFHHFNVQKYETEDDGFKLWHMEHGNDPVSAQRILAWMFYLNDAKSGTEFVHYSTVHAKMGRLVIWPSSWSHVHRSELPNKGLKYIITGWVSFADEE